jgi:hypothetical protein
MPKKSATKFDSDRWFNRFTWPRELLGSHPYELEESISQFNDKRKALEFLLDEIECETRRCLLDELPSGITEKLKLSDLYLFLNDRQLQRSLSQKQANALAVILSAFSIRNLLAEFSASERELGEAIALEAIQFALAAVRGDFWAALWPHTKRGAASLRGSRSKRQDNLNKAIIRELSARGLKQSPEKILESLLKDALSDPDSIVYDFQKNRAICWFDERNKARETSYKSFCNRVSKIKNRLRTLDAARKSIFPFRH